MTEKAPQRKYDKKYFRDEYTQTYLRRWEESPVHSRKNASELIREHVKSLEKSGTDLGKLNYLGIGAGPGLTEFHNYSDCLEKFKSVAILDIAKRTPAFSRSDAKNVIDLEGDAENIPVKTGSIDLATCLLSQDFYPNRDKSTQEIRRILKPGAKAIVFLHHPESYRGILKLTKNAEDASFFNHMLSGDRLFYDKERIRKHYEGNGLIVTGIRERKPKKPEEYWGYWWEVLLSKKAGK